MKNIHVLPTDKPSRLHNYKEQLGLAKTIQYGSDAIQNQHIYITSDEEIKEGDWIYDASEMSVIKCPQMIKPSYFTQFCKKTILTTDQDLIKDGVQAIDDEFLEWFVKNPSCEEVEINWIIKAYSIKKEYRITIPKEEPKQEYICYKCKNKTNNKFEICDKCNVGWKEPKQETLEEVAEKLYPTDCSNWSIKIPLNERKAFIKGIKWQAERSYSEDDMKLAIMFGVNGMYGFQIGEEGYIDNQIKKFLEQFKKK